MKDGPAVLLRFVPLRSVSPLPLPLSSFLAVLLLGASVLLACHEQARPPTAAAPELNWRLKRELDSIDVRDQQHRALLMLAMTQPRHPRLDSLARAARLTPGQVTAHLTSLIRPVDSTNLLRVAQIICQHGYPGKTLVGEPTNEVALLVIQHSVRIAEFLPLIARAAEQGEVPFRLYALMLDRKLMHEGRPQVYGSQGRSFRVPNARGQTETVNLIWPVENAAAVNERRKKAGFDSSVEENAQRLGIPYQIVTMPQVRRLERRAAAVRP